MSVTLELQTSIDQSEYLSWLAVARPGERIVYHRGLLGRDCTPDGAALQCGKISLGHQIALRATAIRRATQYSAGLEVGVIVATSPAHSSFFDSKLPRLVELIQRRLGEDDYLYIACRR
jgi:hypothetical protein